MKVIVEKANRKTKYLVPDNQEIIADDNSVQIGSMIVCDLNINSIEIIEDAIIPEDWEGNKYCYQDGFILAEEYEAQQVKKALYAQLEQLRTEMSGIVYQCKLNYEVEPEGLTSLIPFIRTMYGFAKAEIEALTVETVGSYVLRGPKYEQMMILLKSFL